MNECKPLIAGPFLIVVPLSVIPNWIREMKRWCPALNTIVYVGDGDSREAGAYTCPRISST